MSTLVFDIGGTNMRVALSHDGRRFGTPIKVPTPSRYADGLQELERHARVLAGSKKITKIVGGVAGTLDSQRTRLLNAPHYHGWVKKPLKRDLERRFHAPVLLENDADLVGLGEATQGAGRGAKILAYITISTGIGGSRIVDGKIDQTHLGFEPGHQILELHGKTRCSCGGHGDWESLASGTAVYRRFHRHPKTITSQRTWKEISEIVGVGLVNVCVFWSPDRIVLGGSMVKKPGLLLPVVRQSLRKRFPLWPTLPKIVFSQLGDWGGLYGALALGRDHRS
jgi:glucokinase